MRPAAAASCCARAEDAPRDRVADEAHDGAPRAAVCAPRRRRRDRAATRSRWASRACRSQLGERQTVHALLAALIVHSANDASIVLAHATMQQPAAQAAAAAARKLHRPLPADPVARFVLLMNAEARRLGLHDTVYRTPHGLDEPGAHSSARDVLALARLDMASPIFRGARRPAQRHDPRTPPADQQHPAGAPMRASTASRPDTRTRPAGTSRRAPTGAACGSTRSCWARPTRPGAIATSRACSTGASTATSGRGSCAPGRRSGTRARSAWSPRGASRRHSTPASRCSERIVLPRRLDHRVARAASRSATSSCAAPAACSAASPLVADRAGGGHPALVPWLRSRTCPRDSGAEATAEPVECGRGLPPHAPCS